MKRGYMSDPARDAVVAGAEVIHCWAQTGTKLWSTVHTGGTLLSLLCSTASTLILTVDPETVMGIKTHAAIAALSAVAALAIGIPKFLNAERNWRANRRSRSESRILQRFLADPSFSTEDARNWLAAIDREHELAIMGHDEHPRFHSGKRA
jgi:hypothetical protein